MNWCSKEYGLCSECMKGRSSYELCKTCKNIFCTCKEGGECYVNRKR